MRMAAAACPPSLASMTNSPIECQTRKVVIGCDGTGRSDDAIALGGRLCELIEARPIVASVATWPSNLMTPVQLEVAMDADLGPGLRAAADELVPLDPITRAVRARSVAAGL